MFGSPDRMQPRTMLLADRGYDADWIRALASQQGAWANIPPKRNRKGPICFSPYLYRARKYSHVRCWQILLKNPSWSVAGCDSVAVVFAAEAVNGWLSPIGSTDFRPSEGASLLILQCSNAFAILRQ